MVALDAEREGTVFIPLAAAALLITIPLVCATISRPIGLAAGLLLVVLSGIAYGFAYRQRIEVVPLAGRRYPIFWLALVCGLAALSGFTAVQIGSGDTWATLALALYGSAVTPLLVIYYLRGASPVESVPQQTVARAIGMGALAAVVAAIPELFLPRILAPTIEEICKTAALVIVLRIVKEEVNIQIDALVLGVSVGAGFAVLENVLYAAVAANHGSLVAEIWLRAALNPLGHVIWTGLIALAIWKLSNGGRIRGLLWLILVFLFVAILHTVWDISLGLLIAGPVGMIAFALAVRRVRRNAEEWIVDARRQEAPPEPALPELEPGLPAWYHTT